MLPTMSLYAGYLLQISIRELDAIRPSTAKIAIDLANMAILWGQQAKQNYIVQQGPSAGGKAAWMSRKAKRDKRNAEILERYTALKAMKTESTITAILAREFELTARQIRNTLKPLK